MNYDDYAMELGLNLYTKQLDMIFMNNDKLNIIKHWVYPFYIDHNVTLNEISPQR